MKALLVLIGLLCLCPTPTCARETVAENVANSTVLFTADISSLKAYVAEVEPQTGIPVVIDRKSLQRHGISVNQTIRMPRRQLSVADALDMMTEKVAFTNPGKVLWKIDEIERTVVIYGK